MPVLDDAGVAATGGYVRHVARKLEPHGDKRRHTWGRVDALGLDHLAHVPGAEWAVEPSGPELRLFNSLMSSVEQRIHRVNDPSKLGTAMTYVEMFGRAMPSRPLFRRRGGADDWEAAAHNNQTRELITEFIRQRGSIRPGQVGKTLPGETISEYVGVFFAAMEVHLRAPLGSAEANPRRKRAAKDMRIEDGPAVTGRAIKRLGFRGEFFSRVAASQYDRASEQGAFRWLVALTMYYHFMRPGECGRGKGTTPFNTMRGVRLCDVEWLDAASTEAGHMGTVLHLVSSKPGTQGQYERRPCETAARAESGRLGADPLCFYAAFVPYWRRRSRAVCCRSAVCTQPPFCSACSAAPLFVAPDGFIPTTDYCKSIAREMCEAIDVDPKPYTGYSWRIGAATDLVMKLGRELAETVTKRRGRWASDIWHIYARSGVDEQLSASASMMDARGATLEELLPTWVQPARRWAH